MTPNTELSDEQIEEIAARIGCTSLNVTRLHELGGITRTIMDPAGVIEFARAVLAAYLREHGSREDAEVRRYRHLRDLAYRSTQPEPVVELHFAWPQNDAWPVLDAATDLDRAVDEAISSSPAPLREADEGRMKLERVKIGELILPGISGEEYDEPEVLIPSTKVLEQLQERLVRNGKDRVLDLFVNVAPSGIEAVDPTMTDLLRMSRYEADRALSTYASYIRAGNTKQAGEMADKIMRHLTGNTGSSKALSPTSPTISKTEGDASRGGEQP